MNSFNLAFMSEEYEIRDSSIIFICSNFCMLV